ncbi:MAG: homoserine kinase [Bacteroidetes bacterium]|nr:homoserine kinase [Bacteroidota bacterium]
MSTFTAFAPASLSNLGPGFDSVGVALSRWEDQVTIKLTRKPVYEVHYDAKSAWVGTNDPLKNTASVSAKHVAQAFGYNQGASILICKGLGAGSGLGSSAASAVAGAMAMNSALGNPFTKQELIPSCLAGEAAASGAIHGDNVVPSLMGGIIFLDPDRPSDFIRLNTPRDMHFAVILPELEVFTQQARELLPDQITLREGAVWASRLARLGLAFAKGEIEQIGKLIMQDSIVEPIRAGLIGPYTDIKLAALQAGALGCALSGSGPAMFAVCPSKSSATKVAKAMKKACSGQGVGSIAQSGSVNRDGAYLG